MRILGTYVKVQWCCLLIRKPKTPLSLPLLNFPQRRKFAPFFLCMTLQPSTSDSCGEQDSGDNDIRVPDLCREDLKCFT